jgi:hypothetical protein
MDLVITSRQPSGVAIQWNEGRRPASPRFAARKFHALG